MSQFYLGQVMPTGFGFAPKFWAMCNGQLLSIPQNQALFALLGTTYGGDGRATFALPDLRSRTPAGGGFASADPAWQQSYALGQSGGQENVTLINSTMPAHTHFAMGTTAAAAETFGSNTTGFATVSPNTGLLYGQMSAPIPLFAGTLSPAGGTQPHPNMQPYQTINFNIALSGIFPSRN